MLVEESKVVAVRKFQRKNPCHWEKEGYVKGVKIGEEALEGNT